MINLDDEEILLRKSLEDALSSDWGSDAVKAEQRQMLDWLNDTIVDPAYPIFTGTLHYAATGEGRTLAVIITRAENEGSFLRHCMKVLNGYYYVLGLNVYRGLPPDEDYAAHILLSSTLKCDVNKEIARVQGCHYQVKLIHHINCS